VNGNKGNMTKEVTSNLSPSEAFGSRVFAGVIDILIWLVLFIVAAKIFGTTTHPLNGSTQGTYLYLSGAPFLLFVGLELTYFIIFEWRFGGTVGKLLVGARVVDEKGQRITLKQSVMRNVLRAVDAFPYVPPYLIGLIFVAGDHDKRRLGDKAANTLVVLKSGRSNSSSWSNLS
jgi:uncharacterized RDD family membrane protein YckC